MDHGLNVGAEDGRRALGYPDERTVRSGHIDGSHRGAALSYVHGYTQLD